MKMKARYRVLLPFILIVCLITGIILFIIISGKKPFRNLDETEIAFASVRITPPEKTLQVMDITTLVEYLQDVVIYRKDNSYTGYAGQGVIYTLTMTDGTQKQVMAYNPFIVIDGVGYRTKYEPCEALNSYANKLLNEGTSPVILEEPPALSVISDNTCIGTLPGTYSWTKQNPDGTSTGISSDSAHPLECKDLLLPLETEENTAMLRFIEKDPDVFLEVRCWSDKYWADPEAASENVTIHGNEIKLKPGGYVYEVRAQWDAENGYGGTASYSFYIIAPN